MRIHLFWIYISVFAFVWTRVELTSPSKNDLNAMKRKWDECCKTNVCIRNSCYTTEWRASGWAAVRQRCQSQYPEWPYAVDIFRLQKQEDVESLSKLIQETYHGENFESPRTVWTSGTRCPKAGSKGPILVTRWTSTNQTFPVWLEDKINASLIVEQKKDEFCKFLVFIPAPNKLDIQYDFQDQSARHAAICEFLFPGEVENYNFNETTFEPNSTTTVMDSSSVKSQTMGPALVSSSEDTSTTAQSRVTAKSTTAKELDENENFTSIPKLFCKGKEMTGIQWPDTEPGVTANESCPVGMTGYAQWKCNEKTLQFTPAKPHIQDCKHVWIKELEDYVDSGSSVDLVDVSQKLAQETRIQNMSHGDIIALVDLSTKVLSLYVQGKDNFIGTTEQEKPLSVNFTTSMVASMSNILRAEIKTAWEVLPEIHQTRAASKILRLVTNMGSRLSCIRKSHEKLQFTVTAENIGLQTFILNNTEDDVDEMIVFPQRVDGVDADSSLSMPSNVGIKNWYSPCENYRSAVGVLYKHVGDFLKDENLPGSSIHVATKVISFSLTNNTESVALPNGKEVQVVLQHTAAREIRYGLLGNPRCMFWNFSKQSYGQWDSSGCRLVDSNQTHTVCSCNHLTNFAVLMDVNNNVKDDEILSVMTNVCCGLSSLTLTITLICFIFIRSLHGKRSIITGNLCFSLLITNVLIIFGLDQTQNKVLCATIAGLLHFWILSAFFWMLVEGYHLYRMVILVFERGSTLRVKFYYLFAYGSPLLIVGISAGIRTDDYGGDKFCWLSFNNGLMWSFVGPACAIILVNFVIFILTLRSASTVRIKREQSTVQKIKSWTRGSMSVMCLLGLTWCLGLFYIEKKLHIFSYIFTILNGLQGVFIFLFHVILNDKVKCASILRLKGNKQDHWKKFPPQTSSNRLHSKTSTRTSINSNGYVPNSGISSTRLQGENTLVQNTNHPREKSLSDLKVNGLSARNSNVNYRKSKAIHTLSENGLQQPSVSKPYKIRSQSLPKENQEVHVCTRTNYPGKESNHNVICDRLPTSRPTF